MPSAPPTQAESSAPVLPEGWDTNLRTQLKGPDPVAPLGFDGPPPERAQERGLRAWFANVPQGARWIAAALVAAVAVAVLTATLVGAPRGADGGPRPGAPRQAATKSGSLLPPPAAPPGGASPAPAEAAPATALILLAQRPSGCEVLVDGVLLQGDSSAVAAGTPRLSRCGARHCQAETTEVVLAPGDVRELPLHPPTATPEANGGEGTLDVDSQPWAKVYDGGRFLGVTPVRGARVAAGRRALRLKSPTAGSKVVSVVVRAGIRAVAGERRPAPFAIAPTAGLGPARGSAA